MVRRLRAAKHEVVIESGAGLAAGATDDQYAAQEPRSAIRGALAKVAAPTDPELARLRAGTILVGFLNPLGNPDALRRSRSAPRWRTRGSGSGA